MPRLSLAAVLPDCDAAARWPNPPAAPQVPYHRSSRIFLDAQFLIADVTRPVTQLGSTHALQADACFHGLFPSCSYAVDVQPDAAAEARHEACAARRVAQIKEKEQDDAVVRRGGKAGGAGGGKAGVDRITQQLAQLHADDRTGVGSEEFRALKEARDLEDILFS